MEATVPVQCTYCTVYSKAHFGQVNSISLHAILEISFTADTDMVCGSAHFSLTDHISSLVAKVILCFQLYDLLTRTVKNVAISEQSFSAQLTSMNRPLLSSLNLNNKKRDFVFENSNISIYIKTGVRFFLVQNITVTCQKIYKKLLSSYRHGLTKF